MRVIRRFWISVVCALWPATRIINLIRPILIETDLARIGPQGDGGYLLPSRLESIDAVFSPGVAESSDFELVFAQRGVPCFLIDGSVDMAAASHPNIHFQRLWLGIDQSEPESITLEGWVSSSAPDSTNLLLQMDIEGAEWEVVIDTDRELLRRFEIIVLEIHNLGTKLAKRHQRGKVVRFFTSLTRDHFVAHFHANNCCPVIHLEGVNVPNVVELTLLRKKEWLPSQQVFASLPHRLDRPNVLGPEINPPWD